jgi:predicted nucleic acid-binding protein
MIVVSDTSPICYLLLIDEIDLLSQLYGQVLIPQTVRQELADKRSPTVVQAWIARPPKWLVIQMVDIISGSDLDNLDPGERAAIVLAEQQEADLVLIDDLLGRQIALSRQLNVTGLLGILDEAARQNLVDFPEVISRLQRTTFRASSQLIQSLLQQH